MRRIKYWIGLCVLSLGVNAETLVDGKAIYNQHCAACHDSGAARAPTPETLREMEPVAVVRALETGVMRIVGTFSLNGPQRVAVAEYVTGKKYVANWAASTTNQCAPSTWPSAAPLAAPQWNSWGANQQNTRFQPSEMAKLARDEVKDLELQWAFAFPGETLAEAHASVIDGRLFVGSRSGTVYALDAKTGCTHWTTQANAAVKGPVLLGQMTDGRWMAFFGDVSGRAYAVDAASGAPVWQIVADEHPSARLTGGFQLVDGRLYIPISSLEEGLAADPNYQCCTFRGAVIRVDAATGKIDWKQHTIADLPKQETSSVTGKTHFGPNGASVWSAPTIDLRQRRMYVSSGDNYTQPATTTSDAILALSLEKGEVLWSYQGLPGDAWNVSCSLPVKTNCPSSGGPDHDMGSSPILVNLDGGKRLLLGGQKTGVMHAIDPDHEGALVWKTRVAKGGILGGIEWGSAADDKAVFVAVSDAQWEKGLFFGDKVALDPKVGGGLFALDLKTGKPLWQAPPVSCAGRERCSPAQTAAVTAIPGVVFSGSMSGVMRAFNSETGEVLWQYDTVQEYKTVNGAPGRGGAIDQSGAVVVDGWVYISSGYANWGGLPGNVLLAFKPK
ncbi:MAG: cytochrome C oxidase Cbb3 [Gammaproteobacteria bacterium]|nr:cytochrome C oxidase Cbb3 [Gammaproteobacteria bacterium]